VLELEKEDYLKIINLLWFFIIIFV
jgi:hypothetical protein